MENVGRNLKFHRAEKIQQNIAPRNVQMFTDKIRQELKRLKSIVCVVGNYSMNIPAMQEEENFVRINVQIGILKNVLAMLATTIFTIEHCGENFVKKFLLVIKIAVKDADVMSKDICRFIMSSIGEKAEKIRFTILLHFATPAIKLFTQKDNTLNILNRKNTIKISPSGVLFSSIQFLGESWLENCKYQPY